MLRPDICRLAEAAAGRGTRVAIAPCGPLLTEPAAARLKRAGVSAVSISLDADTAGDHDAFRGVTGAFDAALRGLRCARAAGLAVQINTTVTRLNAHRLPAMLDLAEREGATVLDLFFLVPTGRGKAIRHLQLDAQEAEAVLHWIVDTEGTRRVRLKTTCAPQMARVRVQRGRKNAAAVPTGGCMAGRGFLFLSHTGKVQPCGFLDLPCGDIRAFDFDMRALLAASGELRRLGAQEGAGGKCGTCAFMRLCGGCRARANAMLGDAMGEEPFCAWNAGRGGDSPGAPRPPRDSSPGAGRAASRAPEIRNPRSVRKRDIVTVLQRGIPIAERPFAALARTLGAEEAEVMAVARRMLEDGSARRFGAVFDARRLGYRSELCAIRAPENAIERMGAVAAAHNGVTHCYQRGHPPGLPPAPTPPGAAAPNLWFTLAVPENRFDSELNRIQSAVTPFALRRFPAVRRFKIDVVFDADRRDAAERVPGTPSEPAAPAAGCERLTDEDRRLVRALQGNLPLTSAFFAPTADALGCTVDTLLNRLRAWQRAGTLRRIALIVRHRRIGFTANAMCIWPVAGTAVLEAGRRLAAWPAVTHCYERVTHADWPYNLYAMIHTADWSSTLRLFERIGADTALTHGRMLGSLREFKKTSMRYFEEED